MRFALLLAWVLMGLAPTWAQGPGAVMLRSGPESFPANVEQFVQQALNGIEIFSYRYAWDDENIHHSICTSQRVMTREENGYIHKKRYLRINYSNSCDAEQVPSKIHSPLLQTIDRPSH